MQFNTRADLVSGVGQGHNALWLATEPQARPLRAGLDGGVWLTDDQIISRDDTLAALVTAGAPFTSWTRFGYPTSVFVAGGGNWAGTVQAGAYTTVGQHRGGPLPSRFAVGYLARDASRDGALLFQSISGPSTGQWVVLWPDGSVQELSVGTAGTVANGVVLLWNGVSLLRYLPGQVPQACQLVSREQFNFPKPLDGGEWISYATIHGVDSHGHEIGRRWLHRWNDATQGYLLTPGYSPDLVVVNGQCHAAVALGAAELPSDLHRDPLVTLGQGMVPLSPPVIGLPPASEDDVPLVKPEITVDTWTLSDLHDGKEFVFHDRQNPSVNYSARVWVENGSMYAQMTNAAGEGHTGARREVTR